MIVAAIAYASTTTRLGSWTALVGKARSGVEAQSAPPDFPLHNARPRGEKDFATLAATIVGAGTLVDDALRSGAEL